MSQNLPCPKCNGRNTWLERDGSDVIQRCLCGLHKYVLHITKDGTTIMRAAVKPAQVVLPAIGTKIHACLMAVLEKYADPIHTGDVARNAKLQNKETSALLVALMARGLVQRVEERRGLSGGSTWILTPRAEVLLQANKLLVKKVFYGDTPMALVIVVPQGDSFYISDTKCVVKRIKSQNVFQIEVDKGTMIESFEVSANKRTEILPGVFLSAGFKSGTGARLVIEAPEDVKILRESLYNADNEQS